LPPPRRSGPAAHRTAREPGRGSIWQHQGVSARADRRGRAGSGALGGFLLGATGMFATMYSTQAILPTIGRSFGVRPAATGLTISMVLVAVAAGAWLWGPLSDRVGARRSMVLASTLLVLPTVGVGLAPSFAVLLGLRILQGLCMPGLLAVGVGYVADV